MARASSVADRRLGARLGARRATGRGGRHVIVYGSSSCVIMYGVGSERHHVRIVIMYGVSSALSVIRALPPGVHHLTHALAPTISPMPWLPPTCHLLPAARSGEGGRGGPFSTVRARRGPAHALSIATCVPLAVDDARVDVWTIFDTKGRYSVQVTSPYRQACLGAPSHAAKGGACGTCRLPAECADAGARAPWPRGAWSPARDEAWRALGTAPWLR